MGFLDKAKAAANDLAARADTALAGAGLGGPGTATHADAEKYLRDLGVLAYLEANGRGADPAERERIIGTLRELEGRSTLPLTLSTAPPPAPGFTPGPGDPGARGSAGSSGDTGPAVDRPAPTAQPPHVPPPPPSWAGGGS